jgi:hypothetical protein
MPYLEGVAREGSRELLCHDLHHGLECNHLEGTNTDMHTQVSRSGQSVSPMSTQTAFKGLSTTLCSCHTDWLQCSCFAGQNILVTMHAFILLHNQDS